MSVRSTPSPSALDEVQLPSTLAQEPVQRVEPRRREAPLDP